MVLGGRRFPQKNNENKSLSSKNEFIPSFSGGNRWPQKSFRNKLTFNKEIF